MVVTFLLASLPVFNHPGIGGFWAKFQLIFRLEKYEKRKVRGAGGHTKHVVSVKP